MPGTALEQYFVSFILKRQKTFKEKGFENILLLIELLKIVYYLDIFETLMGRSSSDRIILSNLGNMFWRTFKDVFWICFETFENWSDGAHLYTGLQRRRAQRSMPSWWHLPLYSQVLEDFHTLWKASIYFGSLRRQCAHPCRHIKRFAELKKPDHVSTIDERLARRQRREKHSVTMTTWGHSGSSQWKGKAQPIVSSCSVGREQAIPEALKSKKGFQKHKCWFRKTGTNLVPQNGNHFF